MEDVARHCLAEPLRELCFLLVGWRPVLLFLVVQLLLFWVSWPKNKQRLEHELWFEV